MNTATSPSAVVPFCFNEHLVRTVAIDNDPWFIAKDVCAVLGLKNVSMAIAKIPEKHLTSIELTSGGQTRELRAVSEPGLYRLILRSDKPQAEPFMEWVTAEVLPTIRKTGSYCLPNDAVKTVRVNHTHLRGTTPPGSLDIRYTMDLSKILLHPTKRSLAMLQRLTGIDMADIMNEVAPADSMNIIFRDFFDTTFERNLDKRVALAKVYAEYLAWGRNVGCRSYEMAALRGFGKLLRENGQVVRKSGGRYWVYDIARAEGVASC